jgi:hypothetical protein
MEAWRTVVVRQRIYDMVDVCPIDGCVVGEIQMAFRALACGDIDDSEHWIHEAEHRHAHRNDAGFKPVSFEQYLGTYESTHPYRTCDVMGPLPITTKPNT